MQLKKYKRKLFAFFKPRWRQPLAVVVLAFLARLVFYGFIRIPWIIFDEFIYLDTARQVVRGSFISQLSRDPQFYPPGWSIFLASFAGFIKNPFLQYKAALLLTMFISSLVPLLAYLLTSSLWVGLLVAFYPPLFVYSASIMSETFYIFMLFSLLTALKFIVRDDLNKHRSIVLAGLFFGLFIFFTRIVRSFGIILLPSLILAVLITNYVQRQKNSLKQLRALLFFLVITIFSYYFFTYFSRLIFLPAKNFYEKTVYLEAAFKALGKPLLTIKLLQNELTLSLYWLFFVLPLFFFHSLVSKVRQKHWHEALPRIWAVCIYLFSLALTFMHMFIGALHNPQYRVFSRYLDPAITILFVFAAADFIAFLKTTTVKLKLHRAIVPVLVYFAVYFVFFLPKLDYKFGNSMSVYFFLIFNSQPWLYLLLIGLLAVIVYAVSKNRRKLILWSMAFFFGWSFFFSVLNTLKTPAWVNSKYQRVIEEWQSAMANYPTAEVPLCIHRDGISSETYYLYHFLYPHQYLASCKLSEQKPRRILTKKNYSFSLPGNCSVDYRFSSGESIIYCPFGVK